MHADRLEARTSRAGGPVREVAGSAERVLLFGVEPALLAALAESFGPGVRIAEGSAVACARSVALAGPLALVVVDADRIEGGLAGELARWAAGAGVDVIALGDEARRSAFRAQLGAAPGVYLDKPVEVAQLVACARPVLARAAIARERDELARRLRAIESRHSRVAAAVDVLSEDAEHRAAALHAMAMMGSLATSLAHEIRNPLNAANLQLELLLRRAKRAATGDVAGLEGPAAIVRSEIARLSTLLEEFLQLARPRLPERRPVSVRHLFEEAIAVEATRARQVHATVRIVLSEPHLTARVDAHHMKQALANLLQNACDAVMGRGGGEIVLRAERRPEGGVAMRCEDDGHGIATEISHAAFEPFVSTKPAGTGLGLAIVRKIVAQHGGAVTLEPRDEGGTTARLWVSD